MDIQRKMASVQRVADVQPIPNADAIEAVKINGWWVVAKKNECKVGDLVVYFEVDSWVPHDVAPFLSKGNEPREYNGVKGERLRTIRLRKQLSQGLVLPTSTFNGKRVVERSDDAIRYVEEGDDVSDFFGVQKWEPPVNAQLAGNSRGNFPAELRKTDQPRIQNLTREFERDLKQRNYEVTEKLHGSSCTFYLDSQGEFHVCSRNIDLKFEEGNAFWKAAIKYDVENKLRELLNEVFGIGNAPAMAIQGELVGPGINGNQYGLTDFEFYVFDLFDPAKQTYCPADIRQHIARELGLLHVPVIYQSLDFNHPDTTVDDLLKMAEGTSVLNNSKREGLVFKCLEDPNVSFKVVSNAWLLEND